MTVPSRRAATAITAFLLLLITSCTSIAATSPTSPATTAPPVSRWGDDLSEQESAYLDAFMTSSLELVGNTPEGRGWKPHTAIKQGLNYCESADQGDLSVGDSMLVDYAWAILRAQMKHGAILCSEHTALFDAAWAGLETLDRDWMESDQVAAARAMDAQMAARDDGAWMAIESGNIYVRAAEAGEFVCERFTCVGAYVYAELGCPDGVYLEVSLSSSGVVIGSATATTGGLKPGDTAFEVLEDPSNKADEVSWNFDKMRCLG
ncbi:hypothetical protein [Georgenia subflava]|uniref:Ig-like domain-containing protein n=1 Tax=Georgenia subflava TaxID=1622177 RepID=A0A6N7EHY7_9MICO|nr:hypothetical protein [Georgenia subflava]MPV36723.1 hypothetical protein [Georgenia subflava]